MTPAPLKETNNWWRDNMRRRKPPAPQRAFPHCARFLHVFVNVPRRKTRKIAFN
jgi:hypothetical protein